MFWDFLMVYITFSLTQLKRIKIYSNKHGIYDLSQELPIKLKLKILGNQEKSEKS